MSNHGGSGNLSYSSISLSSPPSLELQERQRHAREEVLMGEAPRVRQRPLTQQQIRIASLQDLKTLDAATLQTEIRVLVTVHSTKLFNSDVYEKGLGCWVAYIIQRYLQQRQIPHKFFMKSILTPESVASPSLATTPETLISFVQRNDIDYLIPSDVTDTMFIAEHFQEIVQACGPSLKMAVTPNVGIYQMLEDKWSTFNLCLALDIPTPETGFFNHGLPYEQHHYPFFLKAASGTNAGRGVWHVQSETDLEQALQSKEARFADLLLHQKPVYGEIICAQVLYRHGVPKGFFFAKSVQADDLAGMGSTYVFSQSKTNRDKCSHEKVELSETQWQHVTDIFERLGAHTKYHGMIDIEFIVASGANNNHSVEEGSLWLLECNPRFSGDIHTTVTSNPGFLDLYFELMNDCGEEEGDFENVFTPVTNYSVGVEMKSRFGDFAPTSFYTAHPGKILCLRHWGVNNFHTYPKQPTTCSTMMLSCWETNDKNETMVPQPKNAHGHPLSHPPLQESTTESTSSSSSSSSTPTDAPSGLPAANEGMIR